MSYFEVLKNGKIPEKKQKKKKLTPYDRFVLNKHPKPLSRAAKVALTTPRNYNDARILIEELKRNRGMMADFSKATPVQAQRMLDFVSGAVFALGGRMVRVRDSVYLIMPRGMDMLCGTEEGIAAVGEVTSKNV